LAKELGLTVTQLSQNVTTEELVGWAAFFELRNEEEQKSADQAKMQARTKIR
jgi:hypothetical protein